MNKLEVIDHVITLHHIAKIASEEFGDRNLASDLNNCADRLHFLAVGLRISEVETNTFIKKAKK